MYQDVFEGRATPFEEYYNHSIRENCNCKFLIDLSFGSLINSILQSQEIKVYNNYDGGILVCGSEDLPKNYLVLKEDEGILMQIEAVQNDEWQIEGKIQPCLHNTNI